MRRTLFAAAIGLIALSNESVFAAPADYKDPLDPSTLAIIRSQFTKVMELANRHDIDALHEMFWQSPSALIVAKSANPSSEGNWAGFWGNEALKNSAPSLHPGRSCFSRTFQGSKLLASRMTSRNHMRR